MRTFQPTTPRAQRHTFGFTVLEMLITMALLGVVLTAASALLQSNQAAASTQQARTLSLEDARASMSRISETLSRADYIYPSGVTITVTSGMIGKATANSITTGSGALAMLISDGSTGATRKYYGVIFYLTDRSKTKFAADLANTSSNRIGSSVLVEARTAQTGTGPITWAVNANPATAATTWSAAMNEGVMADGVVAASTNLMSSGVFSPAGGVDDSVFNNGLRGNNPAISLVTGRLLGVKFNVAVQIAPPGKTLSNTSPTTLRGFGTARSVPRR